MSTFAALKRRLVVGAELKIVKHDILVSDNSLVGIPRKIEKRTSNAVKFQPAPGRDSGSWWHFPKAGCVKLLDDGFEVCLNNDGSFSKTMVYQFIKPDSQP